MRADSITHDLHLLRLAAQARDPEQTQFLLKRIFLVMPIYRAMAVSMEQTQRFLETFEQYYPTARWARQVLVQIATLGTAPGELPAEALRDYTAPGAANFIKALFDLAHASRQSAQFEARIGHLVSAAVHAVMADLLDYWYRDRLAAWEQMRHSQFDIASGQYNDPEATLIAYQFWTDSNVAQRDTEAWLSIARSVEDKLKRP